MKYALLIYSRDSGEEYGASLDRARQSATRSRAVG